MSEAPSRATGRVLCHVSARRGIGHLTRQISILRALRRAAPDVEIFLQTRSPDRHVLGPGEFETCPGDVTIAAALDRLRPDLLLFDTLFPKEAPPSGSELDLSRPGVVHTQRWVRPERLDAIFESRWMRWVRLLLVPHHPGEVDLELPKGPKAVFVGPIVSRRTADDAASLRARYGIEAEDVLVVASLGGGGVPEFGRRFVDSVLGGFRRALAKHARLKLVLVTGPKNAGSLDAPVEEPRVRAVAFERDLPSLYEIARFVIAHGGYNTTNEILGARTPALFLPCPAKYDDGVERTARLVERGVAFLGEAGDGERVAEVLEEYFGNPDVEARMRASLGDGPIDTGNDRAAEAVTALLDEHREEKRLAAQPLPAPQGGDRPPFRLPVVSYHLVHPEISDAYSVTPEAFEAQLEWLSANARVIGPREALETFESGGPAPERAVLLAFDDGYESFLEHALPPLRRRGMTGALFLITKFMGKSNEWNSRAKYLASHLGWDQARDLLREGFETAAHGRTHQALVKFDRSRIKEELHGAANDIREALGHDTRLVAYPYGSHDDVVTKVAKKRFRLGFASGPKGVKDWREDPMRIHRIVVGPGLSLAEFAARIHRYIRG